MTEVRDMWSTPFRPNGLQAAPDGLWVMAQSGGGMTDNHVYKLRYEDGSVIEKVPTGLDHAGGVTVGNGKVWVAADADLIKLDLQGNILNRYQMEISESLKTNLLANTIFAVAYVVVSSLKVFCWRFTRSKCHHDKRTGFTFDLPTFHSREEV